MIKELTKEIEVIKYAFEQIKGTGLYVGLFFMFLLFIFWQYKNENKSRRAFLFMYSIIILLLFFNPLFAKLIIGLIGTSVYWRIFWTIPIGIALAYILTRYIYANSSKVKQYISFILVVITIVLSGKLIFTKDNYSEVNNYFKIPDEILSLLKDISKDDEKYKKIAGPEEFNVYARQYDSSIILENERANGWEHPKNSATYMIENGKASELGYLVADHECNYVVLKKDVAYDDDLEYYGYEVLSENSDYIVYKYMYDVMGK